MKILYDHQIFSMQTVGGISRYYSELIKRLEKTDGIDVKAALLFSNNTYMIDQNRAIDFRLFQKIPFPQKGRIPDFLNNYYTNKMIQKGEFDIFHPTYYDSYFLSKMDKKPFVVTVYDMIHEKLTNFFPKNDLTSQSKERIVKKADKIIAISKQTRDDLVEIFGIDEKKVVPIYLGNSLENIAEEPLKDDSFLPEKYILFVGWREKYKNFKKFVKAVSPIIKKDGKLHLVCVGGGQFNSNERALLNTLGIFNKSVQVICNDGELKHIYRNAACYVFPSLYEGFGLPILEAFSEQCPVACSNRGSLPEVAGEAVIYFDPESEVDIHNAVQNILYDEECRKSLKEKGVKRSAEFSWEKTARETKNVYESIL